MARPPPRRPPRKFPVDLRAQGQRGQLSLLCCTVGPPLRPCRQEERPGRLAGDVPILLDALPGRPHSVRQCDAALRLPGEDERHPDQSWADLVEPLNRCVSLCQPDIPQSAAAARQGLVRRPPGRGEGADSQGVEGRAAMPAVDFGCNPVPADGWPAHRCLRPRTNQDRGMLQRLF